ncbi:MAG: hypothetical protein AABW92_01915, partial [Nanoarchaeota archaeon]
ILLERGITKGRLLDSAYLSMTKNEKIKYMQIVAAHEAYHYIGKLKDLENETHESRGILGDINCLGYSKFVIPPKLCEGCIEDIRALWYGYQLKTGKTYLKT